MARIIAVCNQKGGVGKTTTTINLAGALARTGRRVLVGDLDTQGNATASLAPDVEPDQVGVADVLSPSADEPIASVIVSSLWDGVDLLPSPSVASLGGVDRELMLERLGGESRLRDALAGIADDYDDILLDCPPALDMLTLNALVAATSVLIVGEATLYSLNGLSALLDTIADVRKKANQHLRIEGVVINRYEGQRVSDRAFREQIDEAMTAHGVPVLTPPVPKRAGIKDAAEAGIDLPAWPHPEATTWAALYSGYAANLTEVN